MFNLRIKGVILLKCNILKKFIFYLLTILSVITIFIAITFSPFNASSYSDMLSVKILLFLMILFSISATIFGITIIRTHKKTLTISNFIIIATLVMDGIIGVFSLFIAVAIYIHL